jgi:hypothetical protein
MCDTELPSQIHHTPLRTNSRKIAAVVLGFLTSWVCLLPVRGQDSVSAQFEHANQLSEKQEWAAASTAYQNMARSGHLSANLFLNLGNAEFHLGHWGHAALHYERALHIEPHHPEASYNLRITLDRAGTAPRHVSLLQRFLEQVAPRFWPLLFSASAWTLIAGISGIFLLSSAARPWTWTAILVGAVGAAFSTGGILYSREEASRALVVALQTPALSAPADRSSATLQLSAGTSVQILSERGPWSYCKLPGGSTGWIATDAVIRILERP